MNCAALDKQMAEGGNIPSAELLQHIRRCKRCMRSHGMPLFLAFHATQEGQAPSEGAENELSAEELSSLSQDASMPSEMPENGASAHVAQDARLIQTLQSMRAEMADSSTPAPGELQFLSRLQVLGKEQSDSFHRAQLLHQKVQKGDKLFWRGEYVLAANHYREALMVVRDNQGRVALQNKLARAQAHRHRMRDAIGLLSEGLVELGEPAPPQRYHSFHFLVALVGFWLLWCFAWLQRKWPKLFPSTVKYGDRSRAAQHLYRELAILSQGQDDRVSRWAHVREMRWALLLGHPLELVVSWGRHAVQQAQNERNLMASFWCRRVADVAATCDSITQASANFYLGRVAYIQGRWDDARTHLERSVELSHSGQDAYLKDAALQHLIRVYRNDGNFSEAVRVASQLLSLYHKLGNLPRLSACCRHFALIYASYGDLRQARQWAAKALEVASHDPNQNEEGALSLLRCYVLQGDIELRCGRKEAARRFLGAAIRLQRERRLSPEYLRDGMELLRQILGTNALQARHAWLRRAWRWLASQWAVMRGDLERAHHLQQFPRIRTQEHQVPQEMAYLFQEYTGSERTGGLREAIPASQFAQQFLSGTTTIRPAHPVAEREADQIASMFPVGAVSSRWGRGAMARERTGAITTQFSNASEAPWGYFFADDIG